MSAERPIEDIYPLSPMQQGMLFHSLYEPHAGTHVLQLSCRLAGALDRGALRRAFARVVERHAALRTSFVWEEADEPLQVVEREVEVPFAEEDWSAGDEGERARRLDRYLADDLTRGFDLARPPLLRVLLAREAAERHRLVWSTHLLLFDGWSMPMVIGEVLAHYDAFQRGEDLGLPAPRRYRDFIAWLGRRNGEGAEPFWRAELAGFAAATPLPGAVNAAGASDRGPAAAAAWQRGGPVMAARRTLLPAAATAALGEMARRHGLTLNTLVQGAWAAVLAHGSGARDVVFGAAVSGRPADLPGVESMVGLFINTLPVHAALDERRPLAEWLHALQESQARARQFEHVPLASIQGWSEVAASAPLFDSLVVFENYPVASAMSGRRGSLEIADVRFVEANNYPLTLEVVPGERLSLRMIHDRRRLPALAVAHLLARLEHLLAALPGAAVVGDLPRLTPEVRHQLLWEGAEAAAVAAAPGQLAAVAAAPTHPLPLHRRFEVAAAASPRAVAVTCGEESLTYGELDARSAHLARRLQALGVGIESRVALCLERSLDMVAAVVAVARAGGACVPLDPRLPDARLAFLLADSGAAVLVAERGLAPRLAGLPAGAPVPPALWLDAAAAAGTAPAHPDGAAPEAAAWRSAEPPPESAAYVIYTSGSTGQPKGVVMSHGGIARLFPSTEHWFGFDAGDVWTLFHSYAFDFSVWEMWGALVHGARLVVVPYWVSRSPEDFVRLLAGERVSVLNQTPSAFRLLQAAPAVELPALRWVIFGGEALAPRSLAPWAARHGLARPCLVNMYGITETAVHVTWRPLGTADLDAAAAGAGSPIGMPIPDLRVHLLDREMRLVPPWASGEIHVGGAGLARGYLGRPDLTAERFVPDPFCGGGAAAGARLYRSGDLARWVPPGDLDYLGRADRQVKVRGFRIEPGEVQAVLAAHPAVRDAVVVARAAPPSGAGGGGVAEGEAGEQRLVAYVAADPAAVSAAELRALAQERLPEPMVPAAIVVLPALPLTVNGKVDLAALPAVEPGAGESAAWEPPRGPLEEALAEVWREVLRVPRAGAHDSFFALGGDSIRSIQVVARLRQRGRALTLPQIFQHPTLRELARAVAAEAGEAGGDLGAPPPFALLAAADRLLLPAGLEDAYPLTQLQAGMLFHSELNPESAVYHDLFHIRLRCRFSAAALRRAWGRVIGRHPVLRTSFDLASLSEPVQRVARRVEPELALVDLRGLATGRQEAEMARAVAAERARPFDWRRAPLLRLHVHRCGEDAWQLVLSFHHAVLDGWSHGLLLRELFPLYLELAEGAAAPAPATAGGAATAPASVSMATGPEAGVIAGAMRRLVALERAALASAASRVFWDAQLAGAEPTRLPRWTRGSAEDIKGAPPAPRRGSRACLLPAGLTEELEERARALGLPLKSLALAAHVRALAALSGRREVVTGLAVNGRPEEPGGERALGLFLNTLPLRLDVGGATWGELAHRAFAAETALLPHRRYPHAELQRGRAAPLFEAAFNFVHFHVYEALAALPGVEAGAGELLEETNFPFSAGFLRSPFAAVAELRLDHDAVLLPPAEVAAIAGVYLRALERLARHPEAPAGGMLLSEAELHQALHEWNDTGEPLRPAVPALPEITAGAPPTVPALLAAQAARTPAATALVCGDVEVSHGDLARRAAAIGRHLRRLGIGSELRVGLLAGRTPALVVGLLGIWQAGGAVVPLDPQLPPHRRRQVLAQAVEGQRPAVVVAEEGVAAEGGGAADGAAAVHVVRLDRHGNLAAPDAGGALDGGAAVPGAAVPGVAADGGCLAYVLFTSGSTGQPKGVMVEHRQLAWLLRAVQERFAWSAADRQLVVASCGFDAFFLDLMAPLLAGGTAVLADLGGGPDLARLAAELRTATVLHAVPSLLGRIVETLREGPPRPLGLRRVLTGGEAVSEALLASVEETVPGARVAVLYGPTEGTVLASFHQVGAARQGAGVLGRPLPGATLDLCGEDGAPVPLGAPGEVWLGGGGVSRGYLADPGRTAAAFVPWRGARAYRTGDLARRRLDGTLEFLGRIDQQVKVRGVRIEPGEVEAALAAHPAVRAAAVAAREMAPGDLRLVAYVVAAQPGAVADAAELREHLRRRLPEPMVPSVFVALPALPLTGTGKLDRRALPAPPREEHDAAGGFVAPRGRGEEMLAAIWSEVLGRPRIGAHDDFFALGGHSLLATQAIARARVALGVELPLRALFDHPTVARLAAFADADVARAGRGGAATVADAATAGPAGPAPGGLPLPEIAPPDLAPAAAPQEAPLSFPQLRFWFLQQLEPLSSGRNIPLAVRLEGPLDLAALAASLDEVRRRHGILRTVFLPPAGGAAAAGGAGGGAAVGGGEPVQRVLGRAFARRPLPLADLSRLPAARRAAEAARLAGAEQRRPFDLRTGPLLRPLLLRLGAGGRDAGGQSAGHLLLATVHHIVCDGWSTRILTGELAALYGAALGRRPSPLPPAPQYAAFANWQRRFVATPPAAAQLAYWRRQLAAPPPPMELPAERPAPWRADYRGGLETILLEAAASQRLMGLARRSGTTRFMVLLALVAAYLGRLTGRTDVVVGSPVAGRRWAASEGIVGCFLNNLALRIDLAREPGLAELLPRVREVVLDAFTHQDVPFELLLEELRPARDLARSPLFQVMLNDVGFGSAAGAPGGAAAGAAAVSGAPAQPGLTFAGVPPADPPANFDLEIYSGEREGRVFLDFVYRRDLWEAPAARELAASLHLLLDGALADPRRPLTRLPLVPEWVGRVRAARRPAAAAAGAWTRRQELPAGAPGLAARFAQQAAAHGARLAVRAAGDSWTYAELARRAAAVAYALLGRGGPPDERIALALAPGAWQVAAVLGVLAAGRTYVPLNPFYPPERLAAMLADAAATLVLTAEEVAALPAAPAGWTPPPVPPQAIAYLLYTSGTTGRPKGVAQSQENVLGHILAYGEALEVRSEDRVSLVAPLSFDAAVMDLFLALLHGAELHLFDVRLDGVDRLGGFLAERAISIFHATPTVFRAFLAHDAAAAGAVSDGALVIAAAGFPAMRWVVLGGEEATGADHALFRRHFSAGCRLVNGLGPTESTLALQSRLDRDAAIPRPGLSAGYAVGGTEVVLEHGFGEQETAWGLGEIVIRSPHVALGYWGVPDRTALAFRPAPRGAGRREYHTGDLGRLLPDGGIEFAGRRDLQVKIRGLRIEPAEVEAVLAGHPAVRQAAVVAYAPRPGEAALAAFVTLRDPAAAPAGAAPPTREAPDAADAPASRSTGAAPEALRAHLRARLPAAMVPSSVTVLDSLPRGGTGKVDRRALAELAAGAEPRRGAGFVPPAPGTESELAAIWAELLAVERVSRLDNFFDLGGHSLLLTRVRSRAQAALGVELPLVELFAAPTLAEAAAAIDRARAAAAPAAAQPRIAAARRDAHRMRRADLDPPS